jgi:hypothetical protein
MMKLLVCLSRLEATQTTPQVPGSTETALAVNPNGQPPQRVSAAFS